MPPLIRLYVMQSLVGVGVATVFFALLLTFDVAGLWWLVTTVDLGPLAALVLWVHLAALFAAVQFGIAVIRIGAGEEGLGEGRLWRRTDIPKAGHRAKQGD